MVNANASDFRRPGFGPTGNVPPGRPGGGSTAARNPLLQSSEAFNELKFRLHQRLIEELDPSKIENPRPDQGP